MKQNIELHIGLYEYFIFPGGEVSVKLGQISNRMSLIRANIKSSEDVMILLMLCDALKRKGCTIDEITIPYFPYARQDRVCAEGESFSLKVMANLVNSIEARRVVIYDPHSEVTPALINNVYVIPQWDLVPFKAINNKLIICPDAGAEKKITKLNRPYILCTKERNPENGEILRTIVHHLGRNPGDFEMIEQYPATICMDCGEKYGRNPNPTHCFSIYPGTCDICEKETAVTEPRDFGHLKSGWEKIKQDSFI